MRKVLPNACFIGFTGTPIMQKEKNTLERFGGLIDTYTISQAVKTSPWCRCSMRGDTWTRRWTVSLSMPGSTASLRSCRKSNGLILKKFTTTDQLNKAQQKVMYRLG